VVFGSSSAVASGKLGVSSDRLKKPENGGWCRGGIPRGGDGGGGVAAGASPEIYIIMELWNFPLISFK